MILRRRDFLRAAPAALAPFVPSALRPARAAGRPPTNLVLVYHPNGLEVGWQPQGSELDFKLSAVLAPLDKHRSKLLIVGGLHGGIRNEVMGHPEGMTSMWTGASIRADADFAGHPSIDQLVARRIGVGTTFPSLELGVQSQPGGRVDNGNVMIYQGAGKPLGAEDDPNKVFARLFAGTADAAALERTRREKGSVLDLVRTQLGDMRGHYGGHERQLIDEHTQSVRALEQRLASLGKVACDTRSYAQHTRGEGVRALGALFPEVARLQTELMALALGCGLTRVASLQLSNTSSATQIPGINDQYGLHTVMHARTRDEKVKINGWFVSQFASLLDRLEAQKLGNGGSLLDETLVVWGTEMAVGNHLNSPVPYILAGATSSGYFKRGAWKTLGGTPRHTRLLVSVLHAMGLDEVTELGDLRGPNDRGALDELRA